MNKILKLQDYKGNKKGFEIENFEDVEVIVVTIISGDEVANVYYKNGNQIRFDTSGDRWQDFFDGQYIIKPEDIDEHNNKLSSYFLSEG